MRSEFKPLVVVVAAAVLVYALWEAANGRFVELVGIAVAYLTYILVPKLESYGRRPGDPPPEPASPWKPAREVLWAFVGFWVVLALFVFFRDAW